MIIDSHCHLNYEPLSNLLDETINTANQNGVKYLLTISTEDKSYQKILDIVKKYECVYGTYGIHPHEAKNHQNLDCKKIIEKIQKSKKIIGVGETGLDYYYNYSDKNEQIKCFLEHIYASQKINLPIIVHTRSAEEETLKILKDEKKNKDFKILIHCFTGTKKFAFDLLDLGAYISASGVVTFKKSTDLADTFKLIPENRILVETDSPYLAPVPLRGKPNQPSYITHTVEFLSKLKNVPYNKLAQQTTENFYKLFGTFS
jgi:TatD DNase family protein